jgi:hypothetical protein
MARRSRKRIFDFHGAFVLKSDAVEREAETPGSFIRPIRVRGQRRFAVMTKIERKKGR